MANPEHVALLKQGIQTWNKWRRDNPYVTPDLRQADFRSVKLGVYSVATFTMGLRLRKAPLITDIGLADAACRGSFGVDLSWADMTAADLRMADLSGAHFRAASLRFANFSEARLHTADLTLANLAGTNFHKADLAEGTFAGTVFGYTNLRDVQGLESCRHEAPSALDFRTLAISRSLPLSFLRGCGLSDQLIDDLPSLLNRSVQFDSCFISHATEDQVFAERLHADLQNKGVRCWFAPHDIQGGKKIHEQIDEAIRVYDRLLLVLSEASMNSAWVQAEIAKARKREVREQRRMLFPVSLVAFDRIRDWECFDADTGKDSAREIREYYIPDFTEWKSHDHYQKAFERLLNDLQPEKNS